MMARTNLPVIFALVLAGGTLIAKGSGMFAGAFKGGGGGGSSGAQDAVEELGQGDGGAGGPLPLSVKGVKAVWLSARELANAAPRYLWGGGHGTSALLGADCSGAISYVLNRAGLMRGSLTSGGFMGWGDPGEGQQVTVWANPTHVIMSLKDDNGVVHWFGTSGFGHPGAPNGTGANWFTTTPSATYLSQFTPRHPPGL